MHAITKDGPLCSGTKGGDHFVPSCGGYSLKPRELDDDEHTAEYIFLGKSNTSDYHDSMNNQNFQNWVDTRLRPTFEAMYCIGPDKTKHKKMILVLDNAPYHHNIELPPLTSLNKRDVVALLNKHGAQHFFLGPVVARARAV